MVVVVPKPFTGGGCVGCGGGGFGGGGCGVGVDDDTDDDDADDSTDYECNHDVSTFSPFHTYPQPPLRFFLLSAQRQGGISAMR